MYGAIIGDIVGSIYERNNIKTKDFGLFGRGCCFTDDTVMTCAVASALMIWKKSSKSMDLYQIFVNEMQNLLSYHFWNLKTLKALLETLSQSVGTATQSEPSQAA
nr:hypothetical protein [Candidatus Contubernalis alkalaceticus]